MIASKEHASERPSGSRVAINELLLIGLAVCGGAGAAAALRVPNYEWLAWISLTPFALLLVAGPRCSIAYLAALLGIGIFHAGSLMWICECLDGAFAAVWFLLTVGMTCLFIPVLAVGRQVIPFLRWPLALTFPVFWTACECVRNWASTTLDGSETTSVDIGQVIAEYPALLQIADIAGMAGATWLVACVNGCLADILRWMLLNRTSRVPIGSVLVAFSVVSASWGYGIVVLKRPLQKCEVQIGLASGGFPAGGKSELGRANSNGSNASPEFAQVALVVWPEGSLDQGLIPLTEEGFPPGSTNYRDLGDLAGVESVANELGCPVAVGTPVVVHGNSESSRSFNSLLLIHPSTGLIGWCHKRYLVPCVEFSPWWSKVLKRWSVHTPIAGGCAFDRGEKTETWRVTCATARSGEVRIAPIICYEVLFTELHRQYFTTLEPFPDVFVCAMDGRYAGRSTGLLLSRATKFRAVEFRRPYCRASRGWLTAAIDSRGTVVSVGKLGADDSGFIVAKIPLDGRGTLYAEWGDWFPLANVGCLLCGAIASCTLRSVRCRNGRLPQLV